VTIVFLGLDAITVETEGRDRSDISLPDGQYKLVSALRVSLPNKPLIGVLIHGGTIAMLNLHDDLDAIIDAWYPGMQGGYGISDVLFGNVSPAGRVPVTYYKYNNQLPPFGTMNLYANPANGSNGLTYRYFEEEVQYPFGYGLSYTTFSYSNLLINGSSFNACDNIGVSVDISNTGTMTSDEVVQVYVRQPDATVPVPNIRLVSFSRVSITAGASVTVSLTITPDFHSVVYDGTDIFHPDIAVEKGNLLIFVGGGQPDYYPDHLSASVSIINTQILNTCH